MARISQRLWNYKIDYAVEILTCHNWEIPDFLVGRTEVKADMFKVAYTQVLFQAFV